MWIGNISGVGSVIWHCYLRSFSTLHWFLIFFLPIDFQVVNEPADAQCPIAEMSTRSKLSCLSWNKYTKNHIASSDYEGIVTVWDVTTRQVPSSWVNCLMFPILVFQIEVTLFWNSPKISCVHFYRVWWSMRSMKNEPGVLTSHALNLQCLYLGVMIARY